MTRLLFGTILMAAFVMTVRASEPQPILPIGYFVDTLTQAEDDEVQPAHAKFIRDGEQYDAVQGMEVYPGDTILTKAGGGIAVAFLNNSIVELGEDTRLSVIGGAAKDFANIVLNQGHAGISSQSVLYNGLSVGLGDTHAPYARAATVKAAKLDIIVLPAGAGAYNTTVYCTQGTATLSPTTGAAGSAVNITSGTQALLSVFAPVTGVATTPVTITPTATTKTDLKTAQGGLKLAASGSEIIVAVGKTSVSFSSTIKNTDGSVAKGKFTTSLAGAVTKDSWKTASAKGAPKFSESWSEDVLKNKISMKQSFISGANAVSFSASLVNKTTTKSTVKVGKNSYVGTATYDPLTGKVTFFTTKPAKDGSTVTFAYDPSAVGGPTQTVVVTTGGVAGTPITHTQPVSPPSGVTPDGRVVNQNQPPASQ